MSDRLEPTEFDDLNVLDKSVSIVKLYLNEECIAKGTVKEIAAKLGRSVNSIYVSVNRSKMGFSKFKVYRLELVEYREYPKKIYEVAEENIHTGEIKTLGVGTIEELSILTSYDESYLRRLSSSYCRENLEKSYVTNRKRNYKIIVTEIDGDD